MTERKIKLVKLPIYLLLLLEKYNIKNHFNIMCLEKVSNNKKLVKSCKRNIGFLNELRIYI